MHNAIKMLINTGRNYNVALWYTFHSWLLYESIYGKSMMYENTMMKGLGFSLKWFLKGLVQFLTMGPYLPNATLGQFVTVLCLLKLCSLWNYANFMEIYQHQGQRGNLLDKLIRWYWKNGNFRISNRKHIFTYYLVCSKLQIKY